MQDIESNDNNNQILITNITWNKNAIHSHSKQEDDLPTQFAIDLPENVVNQANKKGNNYKDVIESFAYNFLTRKFDHEVWSCSIWLPLESN